MTSPSSQNNERHYLSATIEKFQDKMAVLAIADGQKLSWPIKDLPDDCEIGQKIRLIFSTSQSDQVERQQIAKTLLNEILKNPANQ